MTGGVFIADDFGISETINLAVLRAHREGALHGASLMVGQAGTEHAVQLARECPSLKLGWHLHLCDSSPTTCPAWPWGGSAFRAGLAIGCHAQSRQLMRREIRQQWRLFESTGLRCDFLNAHHHLHVHPQVLRVLESVLPGTFVGWLRGLEVRWFCTSGPERWLRPFACRWLSRWNRSAKSDTLWGLDRLYRMNAKEIQAALSSLPPGRHEFVFHPRGTDHDADTTALLGLREVTIC